MRSEIWTANRMVSESIDAASGASSEPAGAEQDAREHLHGSPSRMLEISARVYPRTRRVARSRLRIDSAIRALL